MLAASISFATEIKNTDYCAVSGQLVINEQRDNVRDSEDAKVLNEMQRNFEYICKGTRISDQVEPSLREQQLDIIVKALIADVVGTSVLDTMLFTMILKGIATGEIDDEDLEELFFE